MSVLVDTSIWSLVLRRKAKKNDKEEKILIRLIEEFKVKIIGPIRQEILSGISEQEQFEKLKIKLSHFQDTTLQTEDFELAAEFYNTCRRNGIQGSHIDFLICAASHNNNFKIFTLDKDFALYSQYLPINLYEPS